MKIPKRKRRALPKILLATFAIGMLVPVGFAYYASQQSQSTPQSSGSVSSAPKQVKDNTPASQFAPLSEVPARIVIKKIGVDATIESLGLTTDGLMDAPKSIEGVGWYHKSARIGEGKYSVLLDGHYGSRAQPAVFYRLSELTIGDTLELTGEKGSVLTYEVVEMEQQHMQEVDMKKALHRYPDTEQSLTLITCEGIFDPSMDTYDRRTIVYAKRVI